MNKRRNFAVVLVILFLAIVTISVQAAQSASYHLDWFTPLTSGGGGPANSTHYAANVTLGQTASNSSDGTTFKVGLGYWSGVLQSFLLQLPLISK